MGLTQKVLASLYVEAMVLTDEARAYFDRAGQAERAALKPFERVALSCESLKVTTRLMHIVAWLISQRNAAGPGDPAARARLSDAAPSDPDVTGLLPEEAQAIIAASEELYGRIKWLDRKIAAGNMAASPARGLQARLESAF